jgi:hypothetical protein
MNTIQQWQTVARVGETERKKIAKFVFGDEVIPIKSIFPKLADLPGMPSTLVYEMDLLAITAEQRQRLVAALSERFGLAAAEVEANLDRIGAPILAENITVTTTDPAMMTFLWD